jgi:PTS system nitrogen regulatory IIA component
MPLSLRDITRFLNASEATILRWIKQRGLPAHRIGGQYHFHKAELLEWATSRQIKVSTEMFDQLESDAAPAPSLSAALEAGGIFYQIPGSNREAALRALIQTMPLPKDVDRELLLHFFLAREALASTAIGDGIAIPHVRSPIVLHVPRPLVTLCFLTQPIEYGALDGKPVGVLFSMISPTVHIHLQLLSRLSFALHDCGFKGVVSRQGRSEEILQEARRIEEHLPAADGKAAD